MLPYGFVMMLLSPADAVLDFVPSCLSAVVLLYSPSYSFLTLSACYLLLALWVLQATVVAAQARKFLRRMGDSQSKGKGPFTPPAVVIVPFKGLDIDLRAAVRSLCEQDYPDYELMLVVESKDDPAYSVLVEQIGRFPDRKAQVVVAGVAGPDQGQKVHNQLFALDLINVPADGEQAWVFADSDAVSGPQWLETMVRPLTEKKRTGAVTGYRWLIPSRQSKGIWSHFASVMNSSAACMFGGREGLNQAWGGSMAVLAETALRGGLRERLKGALTDDYQMTKMCRDLSMRVYFPNRMLIGSTVEFDRKSFFNFAYRQYVITRVYSPRFFIGVLVVLGLYVAGTIAAWSSLIVAVSSQAGFGRWLPPAVALVAVFIANQVRSSYRRRIVAKALGPEALAALKQTLWLDRWATTVWMTLHWLLVVRACFGRTLEWRNTTYRLDGPQDIKRLS